MMMSRMPSSQLLFLAAAILFLVAFMTSTTTTTTTTLGFAVVNGIAFESPNWIIPTNFQQYPSMAVNVGDTLTFNWNGGVHDVWIHPSGTCDNSGATFIGSSSGTTYTFTENDAAELTFVCEIGTHCEAGMLMDVFVGGDGDGSDGNPDDDGTIDPRTGEPTEPDAFPGDEFLIDGQDGTLVPGEEEVESGTDTPLFSPCYVCGNEIDQITNPTTIVQLPGGQQNNNNLFPVACQDLYNDGLNGEIPESSCPIITNLAIMPCGCLNPDDPNPVCNICGNDPVEIGNGSGNFVELSILSPDNTVSLPSEVEPNFICSDLAASGFNNELTPTQCQAATLFAFTPCGCGINPADIVFDTCNICSSNTGNSTNSTSVPLNPDAVLVLSQQDLVSTCGELYDLGLANGLGPARCRAATARATRNCNCSLSSDDDEDDLTAATSEPSVDPSTADTDTDEVYVCNVCGDNSTDGTMLNPENNFTDPNGLLINCGMLNDAGLVGGIITINDCELISPLALVSCGCSSSGSGSSTNTNTTDAPTGAVTMDDTFVPTVSPVVVTEDGTTIAPTTIADAPVAASTTDAPVADIVPGAPVPIPNTPFVGSGGSGTAIGAEGSSSSSTSSSSSLSSSIPIQFLVIGMLVVVTTLFL